MEPFLDLQGERGCGMGRGVGVGGMGKLSWGDVCDLGRGIAE